MGAVVMWNPKMTYDPEDILAEFGYHLQRARLSLPQGKRTLPQLSELEQRIERTLPVVSLTSETARRETLVAGVVKCCGMGVSKSF